VEASKYGGGEKEVIKGFTWVWRGKGGVRTCLHSLTIIPSSALVSPILGF
jgi:hypothetical protein